MPLIPTCTQNAAAAEQWREHETRRRWRQAIDSPYGLAKAADVLQVYSWTDGRRIISYFWSDFWGPRLHQISNFPGLHPGPCWGSLEHSHRPLAGGEGLAAPPQEPHPALSSSSLGLRHSLWLTPPHVTSWIKPWVRKVRRWYERSVVRTVCKVQGWYEKFMVRNVHGTNSPPMVRNIYGTNSLWYEKYGIHTWTQTQWRPLAKLWSSDKRNRQQW